jgi:hypothetical protein
VLQVYFKSQAAQNGVLQLSFIQRVTAWTHWSILQQLQDNPIAAPPDMEGVRRHAPASDMLLTVTNITCNMLLTRVSQVLHQHIPAVWQLTPVPGACPSLSKLGSSSLTNRRRLRCCCYLSCRPCGWPHPNEAHFLARGVAGDAGSAAAAGHCLCLLVYCLRGRRGMGAAFSPSLFYLLFQGSKW